MAVADYSELTTSLSESDGEIVRGKPIIEVSDEEQSILSHAKTPLPKIRSNPAIFLQECVSNIQSANCQDMLHKSIKISRKFSTEGCESCQYAIEKVTRLLEQLADMVSNDMPTHATLVITNWEDATPEVLLVKGILYAGQGNYKTAIEKYRQTLVLTDSHIPTEDSTTKHLRMNSLNLIGVSLCLLNNFDEAERYFQFALEGHFEDTNFLNDIISKYSEMAEAAGDEFLYSSPIARVLQEWESSKMAAANNAQTEFGDQASGQVSSQSESGSATWFPGSKEELLDYCAAYIQMMIMGIEMVNNQPSGSSTNHKTQEDNASDVV